MARIRKDIEINAPVRVVWRILENHMKHPEQRMAGQAEKIQPIVAKTGKRLTQQRTGVGVKTRWAYLWKGRTFEWEDVTTEWVEGRRVAWRTVSGWDMEDSFTLEPLGGDTRVIYDMRYSLPHGVLGQVYDHLRFRRYVHRSLDETLSALKETTEKITRLREEPLTAGRLNGSV